MLTLKVGALYAGQTVDCNLKDKSRSQSFGILGDRERRRKREGVGVDIDLFCKPQFQHFEPFSVFQVSIMTQFKLNSMIANSAQSLWLVFH